MGLDVIGTRRSVWSVPQRLGTFITQRLWTFIMQAAGTEAGREAQLVRLDPSPSFPPRRGQSAAPGLTRRACFSNSPLPEPDTPDPHGQRGPGRRLSFPEG